MQEEKKRNPPRLRDGSLIFPIAEGETMLEAALEAGFWCLTLGVDRFDLVDKDYMPFRYKVDNPRTCFELKGLAGV